VSILELTDLDGDKLECKEVGGFGEPMLALFVVDGYDANDLCGVNLNVENAAKLRDFLDDFIDLRTAPKPPKTETVETFTAKIVGTYVRPAYPIESEE
jgi:hypothetical protein